MVNPRANATVKAPITETGMATIGMMVARMLLRNTSTTSTTRHRAMSSVFFTSSTEDWMNSDESKAMSMRMPAGSRDWSSGSASRTAAATSRVEACFCLTMPRPMAGRPLKRVTVRSSSGPTSTSAIWSRRTISLPRCATMMAPNSSGVCSSPRVRTANSRSTPSTRPPGISAFSLRTAASTSCTVRP